MVNPFSFLFTKKMVGVDMGTASLKVVELSMKGTHTKLENYGEMKLNLPEEIRTPGNKLPNGVAALRIKQILKEAKIKTKAAIFAVPDFLTFSTTFKLPKMPEKEIAGAVRYNASQYLTMPINEVSLDWRIISNPSAQDAPMKILIVAVPNQVIADYQAIAKEAGLELHAVEPEAFGISRLLVQDKKKTIGLLDLGEQSSTINIVDQGALKRSYSATFSGNQLTSAIASALRITYLQAEDMRHKEGVASKKPEVMNALNPLLEQLLVQIKEVFEEFVSTEKRQIQEVHLTGGNALLLGLKEYLGKSLQKPVLLPDGFADIKYPHVLQSTLMEMNGRFSVALGVTIDGLEI